MGYLDLRLSTNPSPTWMLIELNMNTPNTFMHYNGKSKELGSSSLKGFYDILSKLKPGIVEF
jgi:hypothetical protein